VRFAAELGAQQVGHGPAVTARAVVGRHPRARDQRGALGMRRVAEAEQHERRVRARPGPGEPVGPDRQRGDAGAAAGQDRPATRPRGREPAPERAEDPQAVAGAQLAQPPRARADVLEQEVERAVLVAAQDRERPR
jgi:hypothetical protein